RFRKMSALRRRPYPGLGQAVTGRGQSGEKEGTSAAVRTTGGRIPAIGTGNTISRGSSRDRTRSPKPGPNGPEPPPPGAGARALAPTVCSAAGAVRPGAYWLVSPCTLRPAIASALVETGVAA